MHSVLPLHENDVLSAAILGKLYKLLACSRQVWGDIRMVQHPAAYGDIDVFGCFFGCKNSSVDRLPRKQARATATKRVIDKLTGIAVTFHNKSR